MRNAIATMLSVDLKMEQLSHKVDQLNAYIEEILHDQNNINEQQEQTNLEIAVQIEALNDALDQLRETKTNLASGLDTNQKKGSLTFKQKPQRRLGAGVITLLFNEATRKNDQSFLILPTCVRS